LRHAQERWSRNSRAAYSRRECRVSQQHGQFIPSPLAPYVVATVHPSSILRAPDEAARHEARRQFVDDLKKVAEVI
jgi:uracil-DNA glycosylase